MSAQHADIVRTIAATTVFFALKAGEATWQQEFHEKCCLK
jgi:hypothetical protein